ncbi:MAG TPA: hypothetical protein VGE52_10815 [Pirellulales bacterium]
MASLPSLPAPRANCAGALVGHLLYLSGGQERPDGPACNTTWRLDLASQAPAWERLTDCPGEPRMLAVAASCDDAFWIVGGVALDRSAQGKFTRRYLRDAYRFDSRAGWRRVADLPHPIAAAPSPAPADAVGFHILGGDDGSQSSALPHEHRGFSSRRMSYSLKAEQWQVVDDVAAPRVTVPCVQWKNEWIIPSGEIRPGVRSPEVWSWTPEKSK